MHTIHIIERLEDVTLPQVLQSLVEVTIMWEITILCYNYSKGGINRDFCY